MELFRDQRKSAEDRAADLLSRLSLDEKLAQLSCLWLRLDCAGGHAHEAVDDLLFVLNQPVETCLQHGLGHLARGASARPRKPAEAAEAVASFQKQLIGRSRFGIPVLVHEEVVTGVMALGCTSFPAPLNLAASWNPELARDMGRHIACELRALGAHMGVGPVCDLLRDARWGRAEETYGEDPQLTGRMAAAFVAGLQGDDLAKGCAAVLKHFCGYSATIEGRNMSPFTSGPRALVETHARAFAIAIARSAAAAVMVAYHDIDGVPATANSWLLREVLRDRLGFSGLVVSDYSGIPALSFMHATAASMEEAATQALLAGCDAELPMPQTGPAAIRSAISSGRLPAEIVDAAVLRNLQLKFRLGLFEDPYPRGDPAIVGSARALSAAREIADQSLILLRNEDSLLPLVSKGRIAILGPLADEGRAMCGNYSFENRTGWHEGQGGLPPPVSFLSCTRSRWGEAQITHHPAGRLLNDPNAQLNVRHEGRRFLVSDENVLQSGGEGMEEAVRIAADADVSIIVVGDFPGHFRTGTVGEGSDVDTLLLPGFQDQFIRDVAAVSRRTIVIMIVGRPYAIHRWADVVDSIIVAGLPGREGAASLVDLIEGHIEPVGRLPYSMPASEHGGGISYDRMRMWEGVPCARNADTRYGFGFGLGYISCAFTQLSLGEHPGAGDDIVLSFDIENLSDRDGSELVQLYVEDLVGSTVRPLARLLGFHRIHIAAGQRNTFRAIVPLALLSMVDRNLDEHVEAGWFRFWVGAHAADAGCSLELELSGIDNCRASEAGDVRFLEVDGRG